MSEAPFQGTELSSKNARKAIESAIDVKSARQRVREQLPRVKQAQVAAAAEVSTIDAMTRQRQREAQLKGAPDWIKGAEPTTEEEKLNAELPDWLRKDKSSTQPPKGPTLNVDVSDQESDK